MNFEKDANSLPAKDDPVVLFDGVCNLCNGVVQFVIPRDPHGRLRFAPLQSEPGQDLLRHHDLATDDFDTIVLVEGDQTFTKSDAVLRIAEVLGWPYSLARVGRLLPATVRDWIYDVVADNRYDWFGRKNQCMVPDEGVRDRFLG
ncbi:MAG: thiol-disulfide oxidoreductase DCC family protein [archaeon]